MRSPGINGEGELRGQLANPGSPGKMAVKMVCVCVYVALVFVFNCNRRVTNVSMMMMMMMITHHVLLPLR